MIATTTATALTIASARNAAASAWATGLALLGVAAPRQDRDRPGDDRRHRVQREVQPGRDDVAADPGHGEHGDGDTDQQRHDPDRGDVEPLRRPAARRDGGGIYVSDQGIERRDRRKGLFRGGCPVARAEPRRFTRAARPLAGARARVPVRWDEELRGRSPMAEQRRSAGETAGDAARW